MVWQINQKRSLQALMSEVAEFNLAVWFKTTVQSVRNQMTRLNSNPVNVPDRYRQRWSRDETFILDVLRSHNVNYRTIAKRLGRTEKAARRRFEKVFGCAK